MCVPPPRGILPGLIYGRGASTKPSAKISLKISSFCTGNIVAFRAALRTGIRGLAKCNGRPSALGEDIFTFLGSKSVMITLF